MLKMSEESLVFGVGSSNGERKKGDTKLRAIIPKSLKERVENVFEAVHEGDVSKLSFAVGRINSEELNKADRKGLTLLHYATRSGYYEICKILINHGAEVNIRSTDGRASTPLHIASRWEIRIQKIIYKPLVIKLSNANKQSASWLAQLVRRQSAVREVSGSIPGRTTTQGLKIIEEKVLPFL